jgi:hypothetical protein
MLAGSGAGASPKPPAHTELRGSYILLRPMDAATDAEPLYAVSHNSLLARRAVTESGA